MRRTVETVAEVIAQHLTDLVADQDTHAEEPAIVVGPFSGGTCVMILQPDMHLLITVAEVELRPL